MYKELHNLQNLSIVHLIAHSAVLLLNSNVTNMKSGAEFCGAGRLPEDVRCKKIPEILSQVILDVTLTRATCRFGSARRHQALLRTSAVFCTSPKNFFHAWAFLHSFRSPSTSNRISKNRLTRVVEWRRSIRSSPATHRASGKTRLGDESLGMSPVRTEASTMTKKS